jgi:hypothetical protein
MSLFCLPSLVNPRHHRFSVLCVDRFDEFSSVDSLQFDEASFSIVPVVADGERQVSVEGFWDAEFDDFRWEGPPFRCVLRCSVDVDFHGVDGFVDSSALDSQGDFGSFSRVYFVHVVVEVVIHLPLLAGPFFVGHVHDQFEQFRQCLS